MKCLLCNSEIATFEIDYFECNHCRLIFKNPNTFLSSESEFERYRFHNNDITDSRYVEFLAKLLTPLKNKINSSWTHLDFGSGKNSVYQYLLKDQVAASHVYDLYFFPEREVLKSQYDLVTCSEVVEHFSDPKNSFDELVSVVKPNGYLAIMTSFFHPQINFKDWYYKNDPTHLVFYQQETLEFLAKKFQMQIIFNDNKSIVIFHKEVI